MKLEDMVGRTLGQYTLDQYFGVDSTCAVYLGTQLSLKRQVAVSVLQPKLQQDEAACQEFERVAEVIAQLEHPNIIPIYDYGKSDGFSYQVMRLLPARSLRRRLTHGELSLQESSNVLRQIGGAMDYLHRRDTVHGSPSLTAILFDHWGSCYLGDLSFGNLEPKESLYGAKAGYLAPERWAVNQATPMTDQYALAVIAYRMIVGKFPFAGRTPEEFQEQHINAAVPPLPLGIPAAVGDVLVRALAKQSGDRYPTVIDFVRDFEKATEAQPQHLFISYSRRDKTYADQLCEHLVHNGFEIWIDTKIDYGDAWFDEIDEAIKTSAAFLLLMTPEAKNSEWVKKEILLAKRYQKPIFPLLLDGDEFPIVIDIQFADVRDSSMPDTDFHRRLRRTVFGEM